MRRLKATSSALKAGQLNPVNEGQQQCPENAKRAQRNKKNQSMLPCALSSFSPLTWSILRLCLGWGLQWQQSLTGNDGLAFPWQGCFMLKADKKSIAARPDSSQTSTPCRHLYQSKTAIYLQSKLNCNMVIDVNTRTKCYSDQKFPRKPGVSVSFTVYGLVKCK